MIIVPSLRFDNPVRVPVNEFSHLLECPSHTQALRERNYFANLPYVSYPTSSSTSIKFLFFQLGFCTTACNEILSASPPRSFYPHPLQRHHSCIPRNKPLDSCTLHSVPFGLMQTQPFAGFRFQARLFPLLMFPPSLLPCPRHAYPGYPPCTVLTSQNGD